MAKKEKIDALVPVEEQPYPVPENWRWVRLGAAYTISPKVIADDNAIAAFVPMEKISPGFEDFFTFEEQPWHKAKKGHTQFADGDVAFAKISPCFENHKSMTINGLPNGIGGGTTELIILRQPNINQKFTYWIINTEGFIKGGCATYSGTVGQQRISMDYVRNYPVPLPPFPEQQRIVDRIESLFAKLDEAKEKAQAVVDGFEDRKAAILHKAFTGELTEKWRLNNGITKKEWCNMTLQEACLSIKAGGDKPADFLKDKDEFHTIPVVANGIENDGVIGYTSYTKIQGPAITVSGRGTIGYSICRRYSFYPVVRLIVLEPKPIILPEYLKYIFDAFPEDGTGTSIPQLTVPMIKGKIILLPKMEEQKQIVESVEYMIGDMVKARDIANCVIGQIEVQKKCILAKAFRGELGTNDPREVPVGL